jgi:hypothetical protein
MQPVIHVEVDFAGQLKLKPVLGAVQHAVDCTFDNNRFFGLRKNVKYHFVNIPQSHPLAFVNDKDDENDRYVYYGDDSKSMTRPVRIHVPVASHTTAKLMGNATVAPYQATQWRYKTSQQQMAASARNAHYGSGYGPLTGGHHCEFSNVRALARAHGGNTWKWTWDAGLPEKRRLSEAEPQSAPLAQPQAESLLSQIKFNKIHTGAQLKRTVARAMAPAPKRKLQEYEGDEYDSDFVRGEHYTSPGHGFGSGAPPSDESFYGSGEFYGSYSSGSGERELGSGNYGSFGDFYGSGSGGINRFASRKFFWGEITLEVTGDMYGALSLLNFHQNEEDKDDFVGTRNRFLPPHSAGEQCTV